MNCERCDNDAEFAVYANTGNRIYPMPMARVCPEHLGPTLIVDASKLGSTHRWDVRSL